MYLLLKIQVVYTQQLCHFHPTDHHTLSPTVGFYRLPLFPLGNVFLLSVEHHHPHIELNHIPYSLLNIVSDHYIPRADDWIIVYSIIHKKGATENVFMISKYGLRSQDKIYRYSSDAITTKNYY